MKIVEYRESFGEIKFPEGFEETLKGLSIEKQMDCYKTSSTSKFSMTGWRERTAQSYSSLERTPDVKALIVKDGIIVGVMMLNDCGREEACMPEDCVCTYYADDNNGAGSKTRIDYTYLVCVPCDNK